MRRAVGKRGSLWPGALRGAGGGAAAGFAVALLYYLYEQITNPNPYNALTLVLLAPVSAILGAIAGLLAWAWYTSD